MAPKSLSASTKRLAETGSSLRKKNTSKAASDTIKSTSTATEITMTNEGNHGAGGGDVANDFTEASGTASLTGTDVVFAASGGTVGPFRYVVMYNDTQTSPADPLIAYWDYGSSLTLQDGETFTVDFGASIFTLT